MRLYKVCGGTVPVFRILAVATYLVTGIGVLTIELATSAESARIHRRT